MTQVKKFGKSEVGLIKDYCSRISDEDLNMILTLLPQTIAGDRGAVCALLQRDKEIDRWLCQATGAAEWFFRVDGIGDFAAIESETRSKKSR